MLKMGTLFFALFVAVTFLERGSDKNSSLFASADDIRYEPVGCFRDNLALPRPLPVLVKNFRWPSQIDWNNLNKTIKACAEVVKDAGFIYFGLQFYGECWSGPQAHSTYDEDGLSKRCVSGVGKDFANFVYRLVYEECTHYKILDSPDRSIHHLYPPLAPCDVSLSSHWYRFQGEAGNAMANVCPSPLKCGTFVPGWLKGELPSVPEGKVSRNICFHERNNCCYSSVAAEVRNCGGFYVYKLRSTPYCQMRYCGNGNVE